jgi:hypothetical protein
LPRKGLRLLRAIAPNALASYGLDNAEVEIFLEKAVGPRILHLEAIVFGVSFSLDAGEFADAKLDLDGEFGGQTDSVSEIDFSLFRIKNLQNLLF